MVADRRMESSRAGRGKGLPEGDGFFIHFGVSILAILGRNRAWSSIKVAQNSFQH